MLADQLRDILRHTHSLSFIDRIKVENGVNIKSIDEDKAVVLYGKLKKPIEDLADDVVGFSRMGVLDGYLKFPLFASDNADITIESITKKKQIVPCDIKFDSNDGHVSTYRMMDEPLAEQLIQVPPFKGVPWDVVVEPTQQNLNDLKYFAGILGSHEPLFTVSVKNGDLYLDIGSGSESHASVPFVKDIDGTLKHAWSWPLSYVLSILKLSDGAVCTMSFSDHGALKIVIDSGIGEYEYILPAKAK